MNPLPPASLPSALSRPFPARSAPLFSLFTFLFSLLFLPFAPALAAVTPPKVNTPKSTNAKAPSGKWNKLEDCILASGYMDGDSFHVRHNNKDIIIRLYFVDTTETDTTHPERNAAQAEYFHIPDTQVVPVGNLAKKFTKKLLGSGKFTVWTRWEDAMGSSAQKRYFGVVNVDGKDLAEELVRNGLARVYGASCVMPDGLSVNDQFAKLRQIESRAKAKRLGAWSKQARKGTLPANDEDGGSGMFDAFDGDSPSDTPAWLDDEDDVGEYTDKWQNVPTVAFLRAETFVNTEQFEDAEIEMRKLLRRFPSHPQKARIEFYLALSVAMQERFPEAIQRFQDWLRLYPSHALAPDVQYWLPISMYYGGQYTNALPLFEAYSKQNPLSVYAPEAAYRAACCRYALEDYEQCAKDAAAWVAAHPDHYFVHEANIMRGDALAVLGELDEAKAAYRLALVPSAGAFYYMALTQIARVHKALATEDDYREMHREYLQYIRDMPQDSNIIDAAYHAGWALRQLHQNEQARKLYWSVVENYGNTPAWEGFDLMLADLEKMYGRDKDLYRRDLRERYDRALSNQRMALSARLAAVEARLLPPADLPRALAVFAGRFRIEDLGPETLVWLGREWIANGMPETGIADLTFLLDRFPDSRHAPEARMLLAQQALDRKEYDAAYALANAVIDNAAELDFYIESVFCRAEALRGLGHHGEAISDYNDILANRAAPRRLKPEALLGIAACLEAQKEYSQAIAYYQRVYVLYGAYRKQVVEAYVRSGACFERIGEKEKALNTYRAFLDSDFAPGTAAAAVARQRIAALQGAKP